MLKVGIIGCGGIANQKHLPSLSRIDDVELVAFCDIIEERAESSRNEYGTSESRVYTDYKEMLEKEDLDVVHVCTPNSSHAELSNASMEAGSHVMCEKPMAINSIEAESMFETMKKTGKKLSIGYQNRFKKDAQILQEICHNDELGEIYNAKAHAVRRRAVPTWGVFLDKEAQGGGPLIDIGTHALDLTLWVMDNYKPKFVVGKAYHKLSKTKNAANAWGSWDPEKFKVEDSAFGFIVMENGATIYLESSWALNNTDAKEGKTTLHGTKGGASMDNGLQINGEDHGVLYEKNYELETGGVAFYDGTSETPEYLEAKSWIEAIKNDKDPLVKAEQALVVTKILEAIYESSSTGEPVYLN